MSVRCKDDLLRVTLEDDGPSFNHSMLDELPEGQNGIGLLRMRERLQIVGAELKIWATLGAGTRLTASCRLSGVSLSQGQ